MACVKGYGINRLTEGHKLPGKVWVKGPFINDVTQIWFGSFVMVCAKWLWGYLHMCDNVFDHITKILMKLKVIPFNVCHLKRLATAFTHVHCLFFQFFSNLTYYSILSILQS